MDGNSSISSRLWNVRCVESVYQFSSNNQEVYICLFQISKVAFEVLSLEACGLLSPFITFHKNETVVYLI